MSDTLYYDRETGQYLRPDEINLDDYDVVDSREVEKPGVLQGLGDAVGLGFLNAARGVYGGVRYLEDNFDAVREAEDWLSRNVGGNWNDLGSRAQQLIDERTADEREERATLGGLGRTALGAAEGLATFAPALAMGGLTGSSLLAPATTFGTLSAGNQYGSLRDQGALPEDASTGALTTGAIDAGLAMLPLLPAKAAGLSAYQKALLGGLSGATQGALGVGSQAIGQEVAGLDSPGMDVLFDRMLEAAPAGALTGATIGSFYRPAVRARPEEIPPPYNPPETPLDATFPTPEIAVRDETAASYNRALEGAQAARTAMEEAYGLNLDDVARAPYRLDSELPALPKADPVPPPDVITAFGPDVPPIIEQGVSPRARSPEFDAELRRIEEETRFGIPRYAEQPTIFGPDAPSPRGPILDPSPRAPEGPVIIDDNVLGPGRQEGETTALVDPSIKLAEEPKVLTRPELIKNASDQKDLFRKMAETAPAEKTEVFSEAFPKSSFLGIPLSKEQAAVVKGQVEGKAPYVAREIANAVSKDTEAFLGAFRARANLYKPKNEKPVQTVFDFFGSERGSVAPDLLSGPLGNIANRVRGWGEEARARLTNDPDIEQLPDITKFLRGEAELGSNFYDLPGIRTLLKQTRKRSFARTLGKKFAEAEPVYRIADEEQTMAASTLKDLSDVMRPYFHLGDKSRVNQFLVRQSEAKAPHVAEIGTLLKDDSTRFRQVPIGVGQKPIKMDLADYVFRPGQEAILKGTFSLNDSQLESYRYLLAKPSDLTLKQVGFSPGEMAAIRAIEGFREITPDLIAEPLREAAKSYPGTKQVSTLDSIRIMTSLWKLADYVPTVRPNGNYSVEVKNGEQTIHSSIHGTAAEARAQAAILRRQGRSPKITRISDAIRTEYAHLPSNVRAVANILESPDSSSPIEGFLAHLRSKQHIEGIKPEDVTQNFFDYVKGAPRYSAARIRDFKMGAHLKQFEGADAKKYTEFLNWANRFRRELSEYNAAEKAILRVSNFWNLAGAVMSGFNNLLQPIQTTYVALIGEYGGPAKGMGKATKLMARAGADSVAYLKGMTEELLGKENSFAKKNPELNAVLYDLFRKGEVESAVLRDIDMIEAQITNSLTPGAIKNLPDRLMMTFAGPDKLTRIHAIIAGYRLAKEKGLSGDVAKKFAREFNLDVNFDQRAMNMPEGFRHGTGRVIGQYRVGWSGNYLRFLRDSMSKYGWGTVAMGLGMRGALYGATGVASAAFGDQLLRIMEASGIDWKKDVREVLTKLGVEDDENQDAIIYGLPTLANLNLSAYVSSDIVDTDAPIGEALWKFGTGAPGNVLLNIGKGIKDYKESGSVLTGLKTGAPRFTKGPLKFIESRLPNTEGKIAYRNRKGEPILDNPTTWEDAQVLAGGTPFRAAKKYEENRSAQLAEQNSKAEVGAYQRVARAIYAGNMEEAKRLFDQIPGDDIARKEATVRSWLERLRGQAK